MADDPPKQVELLKELQRCIRSWTKLLHDGLLTPREFVDGVLNRLVEQENFEQVEQLCDMLPSEIGLEFAKHIADLMKPNSCYRFYSLGVGPTPEEIQRRAVRLKRLIPRFAEALKKKGYVVPTPDSQNDL